MFALSAASTAVAKPAVSAAPAVCDGTVQVTNADTNAVVGYLSLLPGYAVFSVTSSPADYVGVSFPLGHQVDITTTANGYAAPNDHLGVTGFDPDMDATAAADFLGGTGSTPPGSPPASGSSSYGSLVESAIWDTTPSSLVPTWINTDGNAGPTHPFWDPTYNVVGVSGNVAAFATYYPNNGIVPVAFSFVGTCSVPQPQTITITSTAPTNALPGDTYTITATGGGSAKPVVFITDPTSQGCTVTLEGLVTFTGAGACRIDAGEEGNRNYLAAKSVQQKIVVHKAPQIVTFTSSPPTHALVTTPYTAVATGGGSGNPVVYSVTATSTPTCTVTSNGVVTFTAAGRCTIVATQAGDADYATGRAKQVVAVHAH